MAESVKSNHSSPMSQHIRQLLMVHQWVVEFFQSCSWCL